jgi:hypothetical protein
MGNPPKGAMSTPFGDNGRFIKDLSDALDGSSAGKAWGKYGDKPRENTNLPASEANAIAEAKRIEEQQKLNAVKQLQLEQDMKAQFAQQLVAEKEKMKLEMELEFQKKLNAELMKVIAEKNTPAKELILG